MPLPTKDDILVGNDMPLSFIRRTVNLVLPVAFASTGTETSEP